ncbi:MAG TPA: hypothetical protein VM695_12335 [Phycisphaerae bacterium]|nr:hypothetical protein [Phycisphaerae bacterium]
MPMELGLIVAAVALLPALADFLSTLRRLALPADAGGPPDRGVVVYVESIRWLGVRWGLRSVAAGLRRAGFGGEFRYWRWHATWRGWLVLPAIVDAGLLEREARRLAAHLVRRHRAAPGAPIHLVGYSCGGYVALRALELLPAGVQVRSAALLAAAVDPARDLRPALARVSGTMVIASSVLDWLIVGAGTLVCGTADRRHTASLGMVGLRRRGRGGQQGVVELRWRPGLVRLGHFGGHFSASSAGFIRQCVAPAMGISAADGGRES